MRKGIKVAIVAALISSFMVASVGADTPSAGESTPVGVVLRGNIVKNQTISGGRPVGKGFDIETTTTMTVSTIGVEYIITYKGTGLHAEVHDYEGSRSTSNKASVSLDWDSDDQSEVDCSYIVYGSHTFSQYGKYYDVYTSLEF